MISSLPKAIFHACYLKFLEQKGVYSALLGVSVVLMWWELHTKFWVAGDRKRPGHRSGSRAQNYTCLSPRSQSKLRPVTNVGSPNTSVGIPLIWFLESGHLLMADLITLGLSCGRRGFGFFEKKKERKLKCFHLCVSGLRKWFWDHLFHMCLYLISQTDKVLLFS